MSDRMSAANIKHSMTGNSTQQQYQNSNHANLAYEDREFISNGVKKDSSATMNSQDDEVEVGDNSQTAPSSTGQGRVSFSESSSGNKTNNSNQADEREATDVSSTKKQDTETKHTIEGQPEQGVGGLTGTQHYGKIDPKNV